MRGSFVSLSQILTVLSHTSRYLDNIFTIDNPALEKHIPDKYQTELISNDTVQIKVIATPANVIICDKDKSLSVRYSVSVSNIYNTCCGHRVLLYLIAYLQ